MIRDRSVLNHPDLEIKIITNKNGVDTYCGSSSRYEPYNASAESAIDCFFKFDIQLAEQKKLAALMK